jgi:hypothetical protein
MLAINEINQLNPSGSLMLEQQIPLRQLIELRAL